MAMRAPGIGKNPNSVNSFNSGGLVNGAKLWVGTAITTAGGVWTIDYTSAGFTQPPIVNPHPISASNTPSAALVASTTVPTLTGCSGGTYLANPVTLLGLIPLQTAGAGVSVQITAVGV